VIEAIDLHLEGIIEEGEENFQIHNRFLITGVILISPMAYGRL
jgi:hypothetical protein